MEKTITKKDELLLLAQSGQIIHQPESLKNKINLAIANQSIPTRKTELWKHTDISALLEKQFTESGLFNLDAQEFKQLDIISEDAHQLVFLNGYFQAQLSNTINNSECTFGPISENTKSDIFQENSGKTRVYDENIFAAMACSAPKDGAFLVIERNK